VWVAAWLMSGCVHQGLDLDAARSNPCDEVLARYTQTSRDKSYAKEPERQRFRYEKRVAECYLDLRRPEKAVALARTWGKGDASDALDIEARGSAQLDQEHECRVALERRSKSHVQVVRYLLETPEFRNYVAQDWFVQLTIDAWAHEMEPSLEDFAVKLARRTGRGLLPLRVASADAQRSTGEWALWTGNVREGHIDREKHQTVLIVDGVEPKRTVHALSTDVGPQEAKIYDDTFEPNGHTFVVKYPLVSERIVGMRTIQAFGRYAGRASDPDAPIVASLLVMDRSTGGRTKHDR
jgi:hypothetical protein